MDHRIEGLRDLPEEEKHPVLDPDRSPPRIGSLSNRRRVRRAQRGTRDSCGPTPGSASDRKSTRLNSSHTVISYAVFCLKTKTVTPPPMLPNPPLPYLRLFHPINLRP